MRAIQRGTLNANLENGRDNGSVHPNPRVSDTGGGSRTENSDGSATMVTGYEVTTTDSADDVRRHGSSDLRF